MDMCRERNLHQVDLLNPAKERITEREFWAQRRLEIREKTEAGRGGTPRTSGQAQARMTRRQGRSPTKTKLPANQRPDAKSRRATRRRSSRSASPSETRRRGRPASNRSPRSSKPTTASRRGCLADASATGIRSGRRTSSGAPSASTTNGRSSRPTSGTASSAARNGRGNPCFRYAIFEHIAEQDLSISTRDMPTTAIR